MLNSSGRGAGVWNKGAHFKKANAEKITMNPKKLKSKTSRNLASPSLRSLESWTSFDKKYQLQLESAKMPELPSVWSQVTTS